MTWNLVRIVGVKSIFKIALSDGETLPHSQVSLKFRLTASNKECIGGVVENSCIVTADLADHMKYK
jgi:hypothetical protein